MNIFNKGASFNFKAFFIDLSLEKYECVDDKGMLKSIDVRTRSMW